MKNIINRKPKNWNHDIDDRLENSILIYEDAQKKLSISDRGYLYQQKWYNYLPFISWLCCLIYTSHVCGKIRCLNDFDRKRFYNSIILANVLNYALWPLFFMLLWILISLGIALSDSNPSINGYASLWEDLLINKLNSTTSNGDQFGVFVKGITDIIYYPLNGDVKTSINGTQVSVNIFVVIGMIFYTIINPCNLTNTIIFTSKNTRFLIIREKNSVFRYRDSN